MIYVGTSSQKSAFFFFSFFSFFSFFFLFLQMQHSVVKSKTASAVHKGCVCVCGTCLTCQNSPAVSAAAINWQFISRAVLVNEGICFQPEDLQESTIEMFITSVLKQAFHEYVTRKEPALAFMFCSCCSLLCFFVWGGRNLNCRGLRSSVIISPAASVTID